MHATISEWVAGPVLVLLAGTAVGAQGQQPSLDHSAPFLGHVLELDLAGAAPGQSVRLLASPQADHVDLSVGTLELERDQLVVVANGTTAMDGTARFELPLSADPAAAESELHLQALVGDPAAPAGAVLSEAVHLRLLGPRVYVGCHGLPTSARAGVWIVSAIHEAVSLNVDLGEPTPGPFFDVEENILFTPNQARGAWRAPGEVVLFDPFFGDIVARVPFGETSPRLLTDSSGKRLAVLELGQPGAPSRVHQLDFETGAPLGTIELPERASGHWVSDGEGRAWVAVRDEGGHTHLRRIDLDEGVVHEVFPVGNGRSVAFTGLELSEDQLFVGTDSASFWIPGPTCAFTRLRVDEPPSEAVITSFPGQLNPGWFFPIPDAGMLLLSIGVNLQHGYHSTRLAGPSEIVPFEPPENFLKFTDMVARDSGAWALLVEDDGDGQFLYSTPDVTADDWTLVGPTPYFDAARQIDSIRDAFADRIVYTSDDVGGGPFHQPPLLVLHDPQGHAQVELEVGLSPRALRVVPVP